MTDKYKVGDLVAVIQQYKRAKLGMVGVIKQHSGLYWVVRFTDNEKAFIEYLKEEEIELEAIYNSSLWLAMREE